MWESKSRKEDENRGHASEGVRTRKGNSNGRKGSYSERKSKTCKTNDGTIVWLAVKRLAESEST